MQTQVPALWQAVLRKGGRDEQRQNEQMLSLRTPNMRARQLILVACGMSATTTVRSVSN